MKNFTYGRFLGKRWKLTFPVNDGEIRVGSTYTEDELMPNKGFICVDSTYCLNQLKK